MCECELVVLEIIQCFDSTERSSDACGEKLRHVVVCLVSRSVIG